MRLSKIIAVVMCSAACLLSTTASAVYRDAVNRQLIIQYKAGEARRLQSVRPQQPVQGLVTPAGEPLLFKRRLGHRGMVVELPDYLSAAEVQQALQALSDDPAVDYAQIDKRMYPAAFVPNDFEYSRQWYLFEPFGINMPDAWDVAPPASRGSSSVVIAVLDSGTLTHRDLDPARFLAGYDFISDPLTANDGDGRDGDASDPGDAVLAGDCGTNDPLMDMPSSWHGLTVEGVIAATTDNGGDIAGIDFAARILTLRVLGKCGGAVSDIVDAVRWAVGLPVAGVPANTNPARVINLSLSGEGACTPAEQAAIDEANAAGAVVVVAAGNEAEDIASKSPANCQGVVAVGATARNGDRASYVNFGSAVDLSAPGGDGADGILTLSNLGNTVPGSDGLATIQGTSYSSTQVSAVAALVYAIDNTLTPAAVRGILCANTQAFPAGSTCTTATCGTGILDANAVLQAALAPPATIPACASNDATPAASSGGGGGGGGGGCTLATGRSSDPGWLLLGLMAWGYLLRSRRGA